MRWCSFSKVRLRVDLKRTTLTRSIGELLEKNLRGICEPVWYLAVVMMFDMLAMEGLPARFGHSLAGLDSARMNALIASTL